MKRHNYNAFPRVSIDIIRPHRFLYVKCIRLKRMENPERLW